jgi:hypothetical protein
MPAKLVDTFTKERSSTSWPIWSRAGRRTIPRSRRCAGRPT